MLVARADFSLGNDLAEIDRFNTLLDEFAAAADLPGETVRRLQLVAEEIITNIVSYSFPDDGPHRIDVSLERVEQYVTMGFEDDGVAFDPLAQQPPDFSLALQDWSAGGLGVHLVKSLTSHAVYARIDDRNLFEVKVLC
jgi:serine/threonine-protein kinase RsbW